MIDFKLVRNALRKRIIACTGINAENQFAFENNAFDPNGKRFYIREFIIGGDVTMLSKKRISIPYFLAQYDLCTPVDSGTNILDSKAYNILEEFNLLDAEKSTLEVGEGYDAMILKINREYTVEKGIAKIMLLFTIDVTKVC
jgi:hypothetical protein